MSLLQLGIEKGLITITDEGKSIKYCNYHRPRNFGNPEEKLLFPKLMKPLS